MDPKLTANPEIQELILRSAASRTRLSADVKVLRERLDIPSRIKQSLKKNPTKWLVGSLVSGLALSMVLKNSKEKKTKKPRNLPLKLAALTLTAARPMAKVWLTGKLKQWATSAYSQSQNAPFTTEPSQPNVQPPGSRPR